MDFDVVDSGSFCDHMLDLFNIFFIYVVDIVDKYFDDERLWLVAVEKFFFFFVIRNVTILRMLCGLLAESPPSMWYIIIVVNYSVGYI